MALPILAIKRIVIWTVFIANSKACRRQGKAVGATGRERCSEDVMHMVLADFVILGIFFPNFSLRMTMTFTNGVNETDLLQHLFLVLYITFQVLWHPTHYSSLLEAWYLDVPSTELTPCLLKLTLFYRSNLCLQDIILFIKSYLERNSLAQSARFSGMSYTTTAVNWACFIWEIFKEHFYNDLRHRKLSGTVLIDESSFGRKDKYHKGNPNRGLKVSNISQNIFYVQRNINPKYNIYTYYI